MLVCFYSQFVGQSDIAAVKKLALLCRSKFNQSITRPPGRAKPMLMARVDVVLA